MFNLFDDNFNNGAFLGYVDEYTKREAIIRAIRNSPNDEVDLSEAVRQAGYRESDLTAQDVDYIVNHWED